MTDSVTEETTKTLKDSKFYALCRSTQLMDHLVPLLPVMIAVEQEIRETNPRLEGDDKPRVFVHYTNAKGNSLFFKVEDGLGLESGFDIDEFLTGYATSIDQDIGAVGGNEKTAMQFTVMSALSYSLGVVTGVEKDQTRGRLTKTCSNVVNSLLSCLYDESKDVMILVRDGKPREDGEKQIVLTNMWSMSKQ